jgi:hypothetical protein
MLIDKLKQTKDPIEKAAILCAGRNTLRARIAALTDPAALEVLASNVANVSRRSAEVASLATEASYAMDRAAQIRSSAEVVALSVMEGGTLFFKQCGWRISNRIGSMYKKYGNWTEVHARLAKIGTGGKNFNLLCTAGKVELTSEWFIATHAPYSVGADVLAKIQKLLKEVPGDTPST